LSIPGDDVARWRRRAGVSCLAYDAKHSVKAEGSKATLILGADDFPFPISFGEQQKVDGSSTRLAGRLEILYRRIGRNETGRDSIQVWLSWMPRNEYAERIALATGRGVYAQRVVSGPGKKDGLSGATIATRARSGNWRLRASAEGYTVGEQAAALSWILFSNFEGAVNGFRRAGGVVPSTTSSRGRDARAGFAADRIPRTSTGNSGVHDLRGQSCRYPSTRRTSENEPRASPSGVTLFDPNQT